MSLLVVHMHVGQSQKLTRPRLSFHCGASPCVMAAVTSILQLESLSWLSHTRASRRLFHYDASGCVLGARLCLDCMLLPRLCHNFRCPACHAVVVTSRLLFPCLDSVPLSSVTVCLNCCPSQHTNTNYVTVYAFLVVVHQSVHVS